MIARFTHLTLLLLLIEACNAGIPGLGSIFSVKVEEPTQKKPIKKPTTKKTTKSVVKPESAVMQQIRAGWGAVENKINQLSKESENLANEAVTKAEQAARDKLEHLERVAIAEAQRISEEASNHASEKIGHAERAVLSKLDELEQDAKDEAQRQAAHLEMAARAKLSALEQGVENKINDFFYRILPPKVVPLVPLLSDEVSKKLGKSLIVLVLISAFGNLSGQLKAWDIWDANNGIFGDQYFPFTVDFIAKRVLAGILDLFAVGLLTIPNASNDAAKRVGFGTVAVMSGRAALIHEDGFMIAFSSITAVLAGFLLLNEFWLVPSNDKRAARRWSENRQNVKMTFAVFALVVILKRAFAEEPFRERFDSVFHRTKTDKK
eukprot:CAMPEP_0178917560 /NCGR_PEP_ID=MMETSP0786-20121207/13314_1 /TAXON_ID=186022 /ORGANISM="Thalassionema frauenfeldii, Strain CCMP 1798" /LENGTH=377 /DNA_ID=CAMNT_0020591123 /DNA_START=42 /DNA_END=1175 /DNA_ORIENTATION=+